MIALPTSEVGRFALYTNSLIGTQQPDNCYASMTCSASVAENLNGSIRQLRDIDRWLWVMGDDHVWPGNTLMGMLDVMDDYPEIDILVPLCTKRNPPWHLVLFHEALEDDDMGHPMFNPLPWSEVPATGVFEVDAAGSAGMLIRREVLDAMGDPWFYSTLDNQGRQVVLNEDVTFCTRARHQHGFRLFASSDHTLGHLGIFNVRPLYRNGKWGALTEFSTTEERFQHIYMPVEEPVGV